MLDTISGWTMNEDKVQVEDVPIETMQKSPILARTAWR